MALPDLRQFQVMGPPQQSAAGGFEALYAQTVDKKLGAKKEIERIIAKKKLLTA